MKTIAMLTLLCLATRGQAAQIRVWTFTDGLEGWSPGNWQSVAVRDGAVQGVSKYDCQLLSPKLNIRAEDYPQMIARVRCDLGGGGEVFFNNPGEGMSDAKKTRHLLAAGPDYRLYRIPLAQEPQWKGTIERLRFDPLNPANARLAIDFIALLPQTGALLVNGGAEIVSKGKPFEWTGGPDTQRACLTEDRPFAGAHALRMRDGGWWEAPDVDLSFLGEFSVTGHVRPAAGAAPFATVRFSDLDGKEVGAAARHTLPTGQGWQPFEFRSESPRRAARARVRFSSAKGGAGADLDEVQIVHVRRGHITDPQPERPKWRAKWIWHPDALNKDNVHVYFRLRLSVPDAPVKSARLQITVDDAYALTANGRELRRTFGETDGWRTPEVLDLKPVLKPGENALTVDAFDSLSAQGLIAEGVILFADGHEQWIRSDSGWEAALAAEGPWKAAKAVGAPPCQPWGYLPHEFLSEPARVEVKLGAVPSTMATPGSVPVRLTMLAKGHVRQPVHVRALLARGEKVLRRAWAPRPVFVGGAKQGATERIDGWRVALPYGAAPGPVALRVELIGAVNVGAPAQATFDIAAPPTRPGFAKAEVRVDKGLPRLWVDGVETDPTQVLFTRPDALQQRNAADAGIPIWSVGLGDMGFKQNGFDYTEVDQTLARYLETNPKAWLLPTFTLGTRHQSWWIKAHPEARCRLEGGGDVIGDYHGSRRQVPCFASPVWRRDYGEALRRLIRHLKGSPFASRIIGFQPCSGITWEWFHWGTQSGELVDYSEAGADDFRRWLTGKYGHDTALQAAWHNPLAKLVSAPVPADARRRKPEHGMFYDPATQRDVLDYHRYQHDVVAESILHFARIIKHETEGRSLVGTYYGYVTHLPETPGFCQSSGHFSLHRLLGSADVDYLMAPVAYAWREVGGTAACMTAAGSFPLHGKLWWNQADLRSHWSSQKGFGRPPDLRGSIECMRREAARALAQGTAVQWYDFSGGWTFGDERLADEARRLLAANRTRSAAADWPRSHYLAVIVDERQMGTFDLFRPAYGLHLIYYQRERLNRAGVPWRTYLFSDLMARPELLEHRAFLLLNLFQLTKPQRDFLRNRLMKDGRTVAFVGPVGIMAEEGFSAAHTSEVLGWPMDEVAEPTRLSTKLRDALPGPWKECAGVEMGGGASYSPVALPARPGGLVMGTLKDSDRPAVVFHERADHKLLWSAVPGLPAGMIRSMSAVAGLPIVNSDNAAVYAGYGFIGLHARRSGPHRVRLPRPSAVRELISGRAWPAHTRTLEVNLDAGQTAIFQCLR